MLTGKEKIRNLAQHKVFSGVFSIDLSFALFII